MIGIVFLHNGQIPDQKPDLAKELTAKWDAWAERADVLPLGAWRGKPKKAKPKKVKQK